MPLQTFPLDLGPTTSSSKTTKAKVLKAEFGDGYGQRAGDGINSVREQWQVSWVGLTRTEANTVENFLRARKGFEAFLWTSPGGSQKKWVCEEWNRTLGSAVNDDVSATFVEVFDL